MYHLMTESQTSACIIIENGYSKMRDRGKSEAHYTRLICLNSVQLLLSVSPTDVTDLLFIQWWLRIWVEGKYIIKLATYTFLHRSKDVCSVHMKNGLRS